MHILCTICSDLVNQAESLYVTKCGHIFHHLCLVQWIERSKSCPQCRNKVTDRCMFRMYPTVSNENSGDDAATLQSRLDNVMLELRTQNSKYKELQDKLTATAQDLEKKESALKATEKRLVSREAAVSALRDQLEYVKLQNKDMERLRQENEALNKNIQTLNGLQKVLNATAGEVEDTLRGYSDLRTLATFAAALKRALCESEAKKRSCRELQRGAEQRLAAQRARHGDLATLLGRTQENLANLERKYEALKRKRKASAEADPRDAKQPRAASPAPAPAPAPAPVAAVSSASAATPDTSLNDAIVCDDVSFDTALRRIAEEATPRPRLKQSGLALCALRDHRPLPHNLKPSELASMRAASIFHRPAPPALRPRSAPDEAEPYDGLGGHLRPDPAPWPPRPQVPKLSSKHKLRRFNSAGSRDIAQMFAGLQDK